MEKNKRLLISLAVLVALAAVMAVIWTQNRPAGEAGDKTVTVTVVHSGGDSAEFTVETQEEYLAQALLNLGLIAGDEGPYGLYITEVDGESAIYEDNGSYWALYENGEYANQGISETPVRDGDSYSLVYTIG